VPHPSLGAGLKAYGVPLFIIGHSLQVSKRPKGFPEACDKTDWGYIVGCAFLGAAFVGTYKGRPFPAGILLSGLSLLGFGLPLRQRCLTAGLSATLPSIASAAAATLVYLGCILLGLKHGLLKQAPRGMTPAQFGQLASTFFAVANLTKFLQMVQKDDEHDRVYWGQASKLLASSMLFSGNGLGLGWQQTQIPGETLWNAVAGVSVAMLLTSTNMKKEPKRHEVKVQKDDEHDRVSWGQASKLLASSMLFSGQTQIPGETLWNAVAGVSAMLLTSTNTKKEPKRREVEAAN